MKPRVFDPKGVGHFNYKNGPNHHIFGIWRVGNVADTPSKTA